MLFFGISLKVLAAIASVVIVGGSTTAVLITQLKKSKKPEVESESANIFNTLFPGKSIEDIKTWKPTDKEKIVIAANISSIIKHMPKEFLIKFRSKYNHVTKATGECFINIAGGIRTEAESNNKQDVRYLSAIPFLQSELKSKTFAPTNWRFIEALSNGSIQYLLEKDARMAGWGDREKFLGVSDDHKETGGLPENKEKLQKNKEKLQSIIDGKEKPVRVPENTTTTDTTDEEKAIAKDLLFLQTLFDTTSDRFAELGTDPRVFRPSSIHSFWTTWCHIGPLPNLY